MRRENVKTKYTEGMHFDTHVIANPANTYEWIVLFKKEVGRNYFLVNESSNRGLKNAEAGSGFNDDF